MKKSEALIIIDDRLRLILFGLQCYMGISFSGKVVEKIFDDSENDIVSEKEYILFKSKKYEVLGKVDSYEPESIWIIISSRIVTQIKLNEIVTNVSYEHCRITNKG